MTRPPFLPPALTINGHLEIPQRLLDELLSALRRHDAGDSIRQLAAWEAADRLRRCLSNDDEGDFVDDPLTAWVHREAALHVAGGRFEHALCVVAHYRPRSKDRGAPLFHPRSPQ